MDNENLVLCLRFRFDLLASLSHGVCSLVIALSFKSETVPRTVYDTVSEFPITLSTSICRKISGTRYKLVDL